MTEKLGRCLVSEACRRIRHVAFCAPRNFAWPIRAALRKTGALARLRTHPCGDHRFAVIETKAPMDVLLSIVLDFFQNFYRIENRDGGRTAIDADGRILPSEMAIDDVFLRGRRHSYEG